jgi:hypothetical protein
MRRHPGPPAEPTTTETPTPAPLTRRAEAPEPLEPSPTPDPTSPHRSSRFARPLRPQLPLHVASTVHPPGSKLPPPIATHGLCPPACIRLPPPRLRLRQHPPGLARPGFTWRVEEGGVPRVSGGPPSSKAQAGSEKTAEGGAAACCSPGEQHLESNRREQQPPLTAWTQCSAGSSRSSTVDLRACSSSGAGISNSTLRRSLFAPTR